LKAHASHATPKPDDCHLRSSNAVIGHHIRATDGDIGHLEDLLVDDHAWAIRHLIVTRNWWGGKRVRIEPHSITDVSWSDVKISVDLTRQAVTDAPTYVSAAQVDPQSEPTINGHYRPSGCSNIETARRP
jgi:hypothetical protein